MHRQQHGQVASARRPWPKEEESRRQFNVWRATLTLTPPSGCSPALHTILLPLTGMSMLTPTNSDVAAVQAATNAIETSFVLSKMASWAKVTWAKTSGTRGHSEHARHLLWMGASGSATLIVLLSCDRASSISCAGACAVVRALFPCRLDSRVDVWNFARFAQPLSTHPVPPIRPCPGLPLGMIQSVLSH